MNIYMQAIRLSKKFFTELKGFGVDSQGMVMAEEHYKAKIANEIAEYLNGGLHPGVLDLYMDRFKQQYPNYQNVYGIGEILSYFGDRTQRKPLTPDPDNLLEPWRFYYHPILQVTPPPPTLEILPDGTFKASYEEEPFYLEIRERFTLDDLVDYFNQVMERQNASFTRERDKGAFRHLLKHYDLDLILFTIDGARFLAEDIGKPIPKNPLDIEAYIDEGVSILEERMKSLYREGLDRVIPREEQFTR